MIARQPHAEVQQPTLQVRNDQRSMAVDLGYKIFGCAALYDQAGRELPAGHVEVFKPGCFAASLANPEHDQHVLFNHRFDLLLGSKKSGTARFYEMADGLYYDTSVADTTYGLDLLIVMEMGLVTYSGITYVVESSRWEMRSGVRTRVIDRAAVIDCGPTTFADLFRNARATETIAAAKQRLLGARLECLRLGAVGVGVVGGGIQ